MLLRTRFRGRLAVPVLDLGHLGLDNPTAHRCLQSSQEALDRSIDPSAVLYKRIPGVLGRRFSFLLHGVCR